MKRFVSLMNGKMEKLASFISRWTLDPLSSLWRSMDQGRIRVASSYELMRYRLRARWHVFKMRWPIYQRLHQLEQEYWHLYDEWSRIDADYRMLHIKHMDLNDELRYWETRHAKVLNYIEKHMEMDKRGGKK